MYCTPTELTGYVLGKYLAKIEQLNPGVIDTHIAGVCAEIDDALRPRFKLPLVNPPETIRRIARVMASFRCVGAITSIMDTEAVSSNDWLPLQIQYKEVMRQLADIAAGKMDIGLEALGNAAEDLGGGLISRSKPEIFGDPFWRRF